jgi:hypothetical protein
MNRAFKACLADARNPKIRVKKRDATDMATRQRLSSRGLATAFARFYALILCAGKIFLLKYDGKTNILYLLSYTWSKSAEALEAREYERIYEREGSRGAVGHFGTPGAETLLRGANSRSHPFFK